MRQIERDESHIEFLLHWLNQSDIETARKEVSKRTELLIQTSGRGLELTNADLSKLNLEGFDLRKANLTRAQLYSTNLSRSNLSGATMICPGMERTNLALADLSKSYLHGLAAQACNLTGTNLSDIVDATGCLFHGCSMVSALFNNSTLSGSTFYQCNLESAEFTETNLQGSTFNECFLNRATFVASLVAQMTVTKCHLNDVVLDQVSGDGFVLQRLSGCDRLKICNAKVPFFRLESSSTSDLHAENIYAPNADFHSCFLTSANFHQADLSHSRWHSCNLDGANFNGAKLEAASFISCSIVEADFSNVLAENLRVVESKLARIKMTDFGGRCAIFRDSDLSEADMSRAYLYRAMLTGDPPRSMSMCKVNLQDANLVQAYIAADLSGANLKAANCVYSRLNQSILREADLSGVNFYQATVVKTDFTGSILASAKGPIFADRCPGLLKAIEVGDQTSSSKLLENFIKGLEKLVSEIGNQST